MEAEGLPVALVQRADLLKGFGKPLASKQGLKDSTTALLCVT